MILSTDVNCDKGLSSSHWLSAFKQELSDVSMKATGWWQLSSQDKDYSYRALKATVGCFINVKSL